MQKSGDELVGADPAAKCEGGATLNEALLSGEDLVSPKVKAERAIAAQLDVAAKTMATLLAMDPVDKFSAADGGEPNIIERPNAAMAQLQWKIAQYILDAAMERLPSANNVAKSIVVKAIDAKSLQAELAKRLKKAA